MGTWNSLSDPFRRRRRRRGPRPSSTHLTPSAARLLEAPAWLRAAVTVLDPVRFRDARASRGSPSDGLGTGGSGPRGPGRRRQGDQYRKRRVGFSDKKAGAARSSRGGGAADQRHVNRRLTAFPAGQASPRSRVRKGARRAMESSGNQATACGPGGNRTGRGGCLFQLEMSQNCSRRGAGRLRMSYVAIRHHRSPSPDAALLADPERAVPDAGPMLTPSRTSVLLVK